MKIGIDVTSTERISRLIKEKAGFLNKVFTEEEIKYFKTRNNKAETIAASFAVKEAFSKAIGTGIFSFGFKNLSVLRDESGKPFLQFSEKGKNFLLHKGLSYKDVSITHESGIAVAVVLLEEKYRINKEYSLKKRNPDTNKGDYGRVGVIGGSHGMIGAPYLTGMGALRTGAGLVYILCPSSISSIMQIKSTETIVKEIKSADSGFTVSSTHEVLETIKDFDAVAVGPGMGRNVDLTEFMYKFILECDKPSVLDADALNALKDCSILKQSKAQIVITPHPLEFSRLTGKSVQEIQRERIRTSAEFSKEYGVTVLLKGKSTVVATPDGDVYINSTGNPGMATAGSGDLLTGIIATFLAQGHKAFEAAKMGAYFHGTAGDEAAKELGEAGLIASDILEYLPYALK